MVSAQTEGDTGYDYNDAYDEEYDDESGQTYQTFNYVVSSHTPATRRLYACSGEKKLWHIYKMLLI